DAVDPAALLFGRGKTKPELLLEGTREDAAYGMTLPPGGARHFIDRCPLGAPQHRNYAVLLRWPPRVGLRLRIGQGLDCRPQLIAQRCTVAELSSLLDTRQSIPQCQ